MQPQRLSRRRFLVLTGGVLAGTSCRAYNDEEGGPEGAPRPIRADDPEVADAELQRAPANARIVTLALQAAPFTADLAGRTVETWGYGGRMLGAAIRARVGEVLDVRFRNALPVPTDVHWHGLALRNDMDGVGELTQAAVEPGQDFIYRFALAHAGTHFLHPQAGVQQDRALYAPVIVDDPADPGRYDADHVLVLDDWLDGFGTTPDLVLAGLRAGPPPGGPPAPGPVAGEPTSRPLRAHDQAPPPTVAPAGPARGRFTSPLLGGEAGDVAHALHLLNGNPPGDRAVFVVRPRARVRLRIINAAADTAYRLAIGGHRLTVTHTDGFPVQPTEVDALLVGMGERYDVLVTVQPGVWPIAALAEGKSAVAAAILRTLGTLGTTPPPPDALPAELQGRVLDYRTLRAAEEVRVEGKPDATADVDIVEDPAGYRWRMDGGPIDVAPGSLLRINLRNRSPMWHPVHLHGHSFALADPAGGPRKDTVNVLPGERVVLDVVADNPGQWMLHCNNAYHLETGLGTTLSYVK